MKIIIKKHKKAKKILLSNRSNSKTKLMKMILLVLLVFGIHIEAMIIFEHLSFMDAFWLTMTTATTVGYGDISASTFMGRMSTIVLLFCLGLWLFAETIGSFIEYKTNLLRLKQSGNWSWKMKDHIVILNVPCNNEERFLSDLINQFVTDEKFEFEDIVVVTSKFKGNGLPLLLQKKGVMLVNESPVFDSALKSASISDAKHIVVVSDDENDSFSDSKTFDLVHKVRERNKNGYIVSECCFESNKKRLHNVGADAVIKPVRSYPGMIVRALETKGSEMFIEDIMATNGNVVNKMDVNYKDIEWKNIVVENLDGGIVIGYKNEDGKLIFNPDSKHKVTTKSIFFLKNTDKQQV